MSRKKKSLASSLTQLLFAAIVVIVYFIYQTYTEEFEGLPQPEVQGVSTVTSSNETTNNNQPFEIYFTSPAKKFAGNTGDSIEYDLISKINSAQTSIYGAFYEFDLESVAQALIDAHNRGIDVKVVYDEDNTKEDPQMDEIIRAGIPVTPNVRSDIMHNKFLVMDNQCVWTGSFNITENAAYRNNENAVYVCDSLLAENYETEFSEMFNGRFGPSSPSNTPNPQMEINGVLVENYFAPEDDVMDKVIDTVETAEVSINFLAFSFTDKELAEIMLIMQNTHHVSVSGIFEARNSSTESSQCVRLLGNGANVRLDGNPRVMHHKVIIIDSKVVIFGSFNFSENADTSNDENLLIVHSRALAESFEQEFQKVFSEGIIPKSNCKTE